VGGEEVVAAEHVEREVAVAPVVAVEEAPLLVAVKPNVRVVEVENHLGRRGLTGPLEELSDEESVCNFEVELDLLVAISLVVRRGEFEAVEGRAARQGRPLLGSARSSFRCLLPDGDREERVVTELVVVVEILVAEDHAEDALREQVLNGVYRTRVWSVPNPSLESVISEAAGGEFREDPRALLRHSEQNRPTVTGELAAVESEGDLAASQASAIEAGGNTLCLQGRRPRLLCVV